MTSTSNYFNFIVRPYNIMTLFSKHYIYFYYLNFILIILRLNLFNYITLFLQFLILHVCMSMALIIRYATVM